MALSWHRISDGFLPPVNLWIQVHLVGNGSELSSGIMKYDHEFENASGCTTENMIRIWAHNIRHHTPSNVSCSVTDTHDPHDPFAATREQAPKSIYMPLIMLAAHQIYLSACQYTSVQNSGHPCTHMPVPEFSHMELSLMIAVIALGKPQTPRHKIPEFVVIVSMHV